MKGRGIIKYFSATIVAFFAFSVGAPAQAPQFTLLDGLKKGGWTLKARSPGGMVKKICLGDPRMLLQIQHGNASCSRTIINESRNSLRVRYNCGNLGHGDTTIRRESSGLVQIDSQGIADNAPFNFSVEGRLTGSC